MQRHEGKGKEESGTERVRQAAKDVTEAVKSAFSETVDSFETLYWEQIQETYDAEHRIYEALESMANAASDPKVRDAFEEHRRETDDQIRRIEEIFDAHDHEYQRATSAGCKGLVDEGTHVMNSIEEGPIRDAALIAAAQSVEHYEMAKYGTLCAYCERLGFDEDMDRLKETLEEEKETDKKLTEMAQNTINPKASSK